MDHNSQNFLWWGFISILELKSVQTNWLHFFSQGLNPQSRTFYLFWNNCLKPIEFPSMQWIPDGSEMRNIDVLLDMPAY